MEGKLHTSGGGEANVGGTQESQDAARLATKSQGSCEWALCQGLLPKEKEISEEEAPSSAGCSFRGLHRDNPRRDLAKSRVRVN